MLNELLQWTVILFLLAVLVVWIGAKYRWARMQGNKIVAAVTWLLKLVRIK